MSSNQSICPGCGKIVERMDTPCLFCHYVFESGHTVLETSDATDIFMPRVPTVVTRSPDNCGSPLRHGGENPSGAILGPIGETEAKTPPRQTLPGHLELTPTKKSSEPFCDLAGQVFGRCQVMEKLGQGGMGSVYKAYHQALDKFVVLKSLFSSLAYSQEFRERFTREARACAKVQSPYVVQVLDAGCENEIYFYLMEYVDGASLEQLLAKGRKFTVEEGCRIIRDAAMGLFAAHREGIIHRDIKASNIMLTKDGEVKVADFGLARDVRAERISMTGQMMGTPQYMAPEQWEGCEVDERSDLYSLGITFYYLLAGNMPFEASSPFALCKKHTMEPPPPLKNVMPGLSPAVESIVMRLLEKKRERRYQNARELIEALDNLLARGTAYKPRRRTALVIACAVLFVTAALIGFHLYPKTAGALSSQAAQTTEEAPVEEVKPVKPPQVPPDPDPPQPEPPETVTPEPPHPQPDKIEDVPKLPPLPKVSILKPTPKTVERFPLSIMGKLGSPLPEHCHVRLRLAKGTSSPLEMRAEMSSKQQFLLKVNSLSDGEYQVVPQIVRTVNDKEEVRSGSAYKILVDTRPPQLVVGLPADNAICSEELHGKNALIKVEAVDHGGIKSIWVQHGMAQIAMTANGKFSYHAVLPLRWGRQKYEIVAVDRLSHRASIERAITLIPPGMVRIPGGTVTIRKEQMDVKSFYIDRTEVTNRAYELYMPKGHSRWPPKKERNEAWQRKPVVFVSHKDALAYAEFYGKRLPTEVEWIVAGLWNKGEMYEYPWGNEVKGVQWPEELLPAGAWEKDRSPWGVRDMAGNVSEWTAEFEAEKAMRKGGNYLLKNNNARMKWEQMSYMENRDTCNNWLGFRCALSEE